MEEAVPTWGMQSMQKTGGNQNAGPRALAGAHLSGAPVLLSQAFMYAAYFLQPPRTWMSSALVPSNPPVETQQIN